MPRSGFFFFTPKLYVLNRLEESNAISFFFPPRPFPWFDLTTVQTKETPFSQHISATRSLQDHISLLYCESFDLSISEEELPYISTVIQPLEDDE